MSAPWDDDGERPGLRAGVETTVRAIAAAWGVEPGAPFALARFSYAAPAGPDAVLKVTAVEDDESDHEGDALELWAGDGAVRLLRRDVGRRALLLERARPGEDASTLPDEEATSIAIAIGRRLWRPAGAPFRSVHDHVPRWLDEARDHPLHGTALELYASLDRRDDTLVHGDFHHHNLLRHGERWVAIDPKPYRGEPAFDIASFLWNPLVDGSGSLPLERTERRLAAFEAAGLDQRRMRAWTAIRGCYLGADDDAGEVDAIRALLET